MTDLHALIHRMADELDHNRQCLLDDRRLTHPLADRARAVLAEPEAPINWAAYFVRQAVVQEQELKAAISQPEPERLTVQEISNLTRISDSLASSQVELDAESKEVLHANLWDLYIIPNKPEGPTNEELLEAVKAGVASFPPRHPEALNLSAVEYEVELEIRKARAVLARWGNHPGSPDSSTPQPVPVSERLPGPSDCAPWPKDSDASAWCWVGTDKDGGWDWEQRSAGCLVMFPGDFTHWLPAHALPLPD